MAKAFINEMEVGGQFTNLESYNQNMAKGLQDKLFFLTKLPINDGDEWLIVDFGCADGTLIGALASIFKGSGIQAKLIGYDISETMVNLAKKKYNSLSEVNISGKNLIVNFTSNWKQVNQYIKYSKGKKAVVLSSVIHEVYSYAGSQNDIDEFWDRICNSGFDYICIRDMMASKSIERKTDENLYSTFLGQVHENKPELIRYINDFQYQWGSLRENKNFVHYLLKYRWITNWTREVRENYFPIHVEEFLTHFNGYKTVYLEKFRLPFLEDCWKQDFNISIKDNTHIKAIFAL